ncbi:MAG TPA: futalosine hydrolase [Bacteroidales bacterium]|nr:futalosine hydrolase [Bacteroidales bacterium]
MKILIVSATFAEIQPLLNNLGIAVVKNKNCFHSRIALHEISILITGPGMVATAFYLGEINLQNFDIALNTGIAGSFSKDIAIGELVQVTNDCFAELGADYGENFVPLCKLDFSPDLPDPVFDEQGKIINPTTNNNPRIKQLKSVKGITVNTINAEAKRIERIKSLFDPDTESMEGAAFLYACLKKKIPCFQLRSISNYIEPRNLNHWNIPFAIANLNRKLPEIISAF